MQEVTGVGHAWEEFSKLDPFDVCKRAGVSFDDSLKEYTVNSFGQQIFISTKRQQIYSDSPKGRCLVGIREYFFDLSILWYLIGAKDRPLSSELIKPSAVPGGQIFMQGTHVLPLDTIAHKYNGKKNLFLEVGSRYGSVEAEYGDVAVKLLPFPRVPVHLLLWFGDENFPPQGQLLLDSTCPFHLSTDVIWAMTMVCCLLFLRDS